MLDGVDVEQNLNADFRRLLGCLSVIKNFASFLSSRSEAILTPQGARPTQGLRQLSRVTHRS